MSTTLTIRNLEKPIKQKLRMQAASHGRSMEAEAREILTRVVQQGAGLIVADTARTATPVLANKNKGKFDHVIGIWKGRMTTDEIMQLTRGE